MTIKSLSPVLVVEAIEPCLTFWERLGFVRSNEVPHEDRLGFVMLSRDNLTVMYQSRASVQADVPALGERLSYSALYFIVDDLAEIQRLLEGADLVVPFRKTFYGAQEVIAREPAGNIVSFAQFAEG